MDPLLDGLDARQREAVTSNAVPLAILAPAGSGKTRVLTRRIAWRTRAGLADARHVLAVTFTRKAAGELVERLSNLGIEVAGFTAATFHALALAELRRRATEQGRPAPTVLASKSRLLATIAEDTRRGTSARPRNAGLSELAAEIEWAKARMVLPEGYTAAAVAAGRRLPRPAPEIADLYAAYEREKRKRRCYDFDDMLWVYADAVEQDPVFAAGQRWRFRHLFVDEFQDATPLQVRLLRAVLGDRVDLCVVGDVAQAIYGFAGADASALSAFADHFPGGHIVALDHNYRSTHQVLAVAEAALGAGSGVDRPPARAVRPEGNAARIHAHDDESAEAAAVARSCWQAFAAGVTWDDMAVLFRTNAQSAHFEAALARRGIPCRLAASARFSERPAVRTLLDELRLAERETRGRAFAEHLADLAQDRSDTDNTAEGAVATAAEEELREHRDALLRLGRDYVAAEGGSSSVSGFVAWLDLATRAESEGGPAVDLLTFHRAKGLEWRVVFVTGLEQGFVPISWATSPAALAEERRLLHVALGRAADELHISWARNRTMNGQAVVRSPSPWLERLEVRAAAVTPAPVDKREALAGARAALEAATPPQPVRRRTR